MATAWTKHLISVPPMRESLAVVNWCVNQYQVLPNPGKSDRMKTRKLNIETGNLWSIKTWCFKTPLPSPKLPKAKIYPSLKGFGFCALGHSANNGICRYSISLAGLRVMMGSLWQLFACSTFPDDTSSSERQHLRPQPSRGENDYLQSSLFPDNMVKASSK